MRDFGAPISPERFKTITRLTAQLFAELPDKHNVYGEALAMDDAALLVLETAEVSDEFGNKFKLSATKPAACPPFEWRYEISSDLGDSEYFKHYLIREDDIVLAQRKLLTPIDDDEARIIEADLTAARELMEHPPDQE